MGTDRVRVGQIAREAGVNVETLRYYERRGLLEEPERSPSGYRAYGAETVRLIRFIKRAQTLGFTLDEIQELIALRDAKDRKRGEVRTLAQAKIKNIDEKLAQLQSMREALATLVESCACRAARPTCPILEAFDDPEN